jgi:hypothetical protein
MVCGTDRTSFSRIVTSPAARAVIFLLKFSKRVGGRPLSAPELPS